MRDWKKGVTPAASATFRSSQPDRKAHARRLSPLLAVGLFLESGLAAAQHDASIFRDADIALGEKLIAENRCAACHIQKFGGDGRSIFRPSVLNRDFYRFK